ncbi:DUF262 domain-containing HNH endonuclease family protein [Companilactobacillus ginsenosidimutans]|uniref:DUF262 domain-containing protein n=1 Tax=Companilactobacillus ginsenosidimutans TaxID=1007676 RepID=A0A0H4QGA2_9LACO|nr:DUF1524 domain-containing protein [Companilactobacillus ginsenosidimutans]AKP67429.1 hypothetical protein ABM34_07705 [Companilactobacillus ginsenosidimutans]
MANLEDLIQARTKSLDKYLQNDKDTNFLIPFSQRKYEWDKPEVRRLFNDLTSLYGLSNDEVHMLNFFTFSRDDENNLKIFDGQQRTVTCMLILAVIAQKLYQSGDTEAAEQISDSYFIKKDKLRKETPVQQKLTFDSAEDNEFFYKVTNFQFNLEEEFESKKPNEYINNQKTIARNMIFIDQLLNEFIKSNENVDLSKLVVSITDRTLLVEFIANSEEIALSMFESLNNTGKSIEKYYVLKNDMVKCLGEDEVKPIWNVIDANLSELNHNSFLNATATLFKGKTTNKVALENLYSNTDINSIEDMKQLLVFLREASEEYLKICNANQMEYSDTRIRDTYRRYIKNLSVFNMKQHIPVILAMLMINTDLKDINRVLRVILEFTVKNFYFDEQKANKIELKFTSYANKVYNKEMSIDILIESIQKLCIDDKQLHEAILNKTISQNSRIAFILRETYNYAYQNKEIEVSGINNDVEHILPRNPDENSKWMSWFADDELREKWTYSIGNLTLWFEKDNRGSKNADFDKKKEKYIDSSLEENRRIASNDQWTIHEIQNRANYLADEIIQAFDD